MAKRFNISIPDALAERLEPHKDTISLSAVMQAAIERELSRLSGQCRDEERRAQFRSAAMNAWLQRNSHLANAIEAFVDDLVDRAIGEGSAEVFRHYRLLYMHWKRDELIEKLLKKNDSVSHAFDYSGTSEEEARSNINRVIDDALGNYIGDLMFSSALLEFVESRIDQEDSFFPDCYLESDPIKATRKVGDHLGSLIFSDMTEEMGFKILDRRVRELLDEKEIELYLLDLHNAFANMEGAK